MDNSLSHRVHNFDRMAVRKDEFQARQTSEILYCISSETDRSRTWEIQVAAYGLGVCAEYGGSAYKSLVGGIRLCKRNPNVVLPENVMAYDNDVSALGKICNFHRESIDSAQHATFSCCRRTL
ncbi:hypothetical protein KY290_017246 [Solanum tuberosum]|uniref:Uncharacterized protein n=1 Tax=Solanum tuberosum TaxID=4113 RepID=A0ABQ7VBM6_SOLTU|nr:hypothetical protein KY284_016271 [Solanum tuberosum]KAH0702004.1 hypothetical protein KY285_016282 [Solanum tuberosum]KAH0761173.1 hypothetical protein KY290_017246 [Solanum tuberosum]